MKAKFLLVTTQGFEDQVQTLPGEVKRQLAKRLEQLATNPRYPALRTHEVEGAVWGLEQ